ncbi:hypothetical protein Stsp01_14910 [Streptomyces sp. NBRC 13847]|nr:hypothetical protein Stsp01_14910 [Streptomyces sp. NBRC 13847]
MRESRASGVRGLLRIRPTPRWIVPLFTGLGLALVPWTLYLAITLPRRATLDSYDAPWVGFDIGLAGLILLTAVLARRRHRQVGLAAVAVSTMLVADAWFDVTTTPGGGTRGIAVALAIAFVVELPLAGLSLWLALTAGDLVGTRLPGRGAATAPPGGTHPRFRRTGDGTGRLRPVGRRSRHSGGMNADGREMLARGRVATRLPAQDLDRARRFYAERLGLEPVDERPGGLLYRCGGVDFVVFRSTGTSPGTFTQMAWEVEDIESVVSALEARGVVFEEVDLPGLLGGGRTTDSIAEIEGNYPSKGARGERGAWFRDSEGNLLGIGQLVR